MIQLADQVVDAVKSGALKKFVAMAACDDRVKDRSYYTEFTENLPQDVGCRSVQPLPAFLSPNVAKVLTVNFGISGIETVEEDLNILV